MDEFLDTIRRWCDPERRLFGTGSPVVAARAPGRLDVMGGIADYSGSLVLELPIRESTHVAAQQATDGRLQIVSLPIGDAGQIRSFNLAPDAWRELLASDYVAVERRFAKNSADAWAAYVVGVLCVLARERSCRFDNGVRILVASTVPEGKGVSSSAALEVATMRAVAEVVGCELDGTELAQLCQLAENRVAGAPCGIMDQMTSALGREDHLLALLCQPAEVQGHVPIPSGIRFWGIDSGVRHAVSGADYTVIRTAAFMGYRVMAEATGLSATATKTPGIVRVDDPNWNGYLAKLTPQEFESQYAQEIPSEMRGGEFLATYGGTTDVVTRVDPGVVYPVVAATAHPIYENARVRRFEKLMASRLDETDLKELGELMVASHGSYSACGLGSDATDALVELVRHAGPKRGLYGAKITGGGSGGTVAVLGRADARAEILAISRQFASQAGRMPYVFQGSSPGACLSPCVQIELE